MSNSTAPTHPTDNRVRRWHLIVLSILLAIGGVLRIHRLPAESLGVDELFSVHFATGRGPWETALPANQWRQPAEDIQSIHTAPPWWRIWTSMGFDTHPPLHPILLRWWMIVFGESDIAVRSLSVVFSLCLLLLLFDAARTTAGATAGLWAAAIGTFAGPQIEFAQECRSYMMLAALSAAAVAIVARIIMHGATWRRSIAFAAVSLAMMLTHYWAIGVITPLFVVITVASRDQTRWRPIIACAIAAVLFGVAWGSFLLEQRGNFTNNMGWIADTEPRLFLRSLRRAAVLPLRLLFEPSQTYLRSAETGQGFTWLAPAVMYLGAIALMRRRECWVWSACFLGPIALVFIADLTQQRQTLNLMRYTLAASIGLYGLLATSAARSGWIAHVIPAAAVLGCLGALPMAWQREKPPWRDFAALAAGDLTTDDALVLLRNRENKWLGAIVYMAVNRYTEALPCAAVVLDETADETTLHRLRGARRVVVISDSADPPVDRLLPGAIAIGRAAWLPRAGSYVEVAFVKSTTKP